jgi:anti-sigma regulatory factor (Ser/Thr protein kinase)
LLPTPHSVAIARTLVRHRLIGFRFADLIDDAQVIVSELVTNAIAATESDDPKTRGHIKMTLLPNIGRPLLEVWDSAPELPVIRAAGPAAESGRGLHIVRRLSADFGWRTNTRRGGKTVWALLV